MHAAVEMFLDHSPVPRQTVLARLRGWTSNPGVEHWSRQVSPNLGSVRQSEVEMVAPWGATKGSQAVAVEKKKIRIKYIFNTFMHLLNQQYMYNL